MPVISGVLTDGAGEALTNHTIELVACNNTTQVIKTTTARPGTTAGHYRIEARTGVYDVLLRAPGCPPSRAGTIQVYPDSPPGTLNDFLCTPDSDSLTPEVIREFRGMAVQSANSEANAKTSETNSKTSADNAKTSEARAAVSETNAQTSETNAQTSEANAQTSEANAAVSATEAKTSETNAQTSEANAKTSEANAQTSEANAQTSEANAKTSETNSKTSADNAKTSEARAAVSETNAQTSEANAAVSATAAKVSEAKAQTSEANAKTSADNANASATDIRAALAKLGDAGTNPGGSTPGLQWYDAGNADVFEYGMNDVPVLHHQRNAAGFYATYDYLTGGAPLVTGYNLIRCGQAGIAVSWSGMFAFTSGKEWTLLDCAGRDLVEAQSVKTWPGAHLLCYIALTRGSLRDPQYLRQPEEGTLYSFPGAGGDSFPRDPDIPDIRDLTAPGQPTYVFPADEDLQNSDIPGTWEYRGFTNARSGYPGVKILVYHGASFYCTLGEFIRTA